MKIVHKPILNTDKVCSLYSDRDGVPVSYVCTTEQARISPLFDVFYRETPHPEFGNRYFGIFQSDDDLFIAKADWVESLVFCMIEVDNCWHYSRYTHDFNVVGDCFIDGGREYGRFGGSNLPNTANFQVRDGVFVEV